MCDVDIKGDLIDPHLKLELALANVSFSLERSLGAFNVKIYVQYGHICSLTNKYYHLHAICIDAEYEYLFMPVKG